MVSGRGGCESPSIRTPTRKGGVWGTRLGAPEPFGMTDEKMVGVALFDRRKVLGRAWFWTVKRSCAKAFWRLISVVTNVMQNQRRSPIHNLVAWHPDF